MARPTLGRTLFPEDDGYPEGLRRLARPPELLHVDGALDGLDRAVGIVGTRRATPDALDLARTLARELAERGVLIVSGGAEGIDAAAHEGALEARGGRTIAALPTALASPYPRAHAGLFARIAQRGARLTEHVRAGSVHRAHFVERNRIIAALSRAVVIVQAPLPSGALATAEDARELGIPVLVVPWSPREPAAAGGLALLAGKGTARIARDAGDVLAAIGDAPARTTRRRTKSPQLPLLDPDQALLLAALDDTALDREALVSRVQLPTARSQAALARLVLDGLVHEDAHGVRRLRG